MKNKTTPGKVTEFLSSFPVLLLCQLILGGLFIYASLDKIANPKAFATIVHNYKILPDLVINFFAVTLPWVELLAGILLVAGLFRKAAALALSGLLAVFIVAISFNLIRGLNFDCGCFTTVASVEKSDPVGLLIRDLFLLIPGLVIIFFQREKDDDKTNNMQLSPQIQ